MTSPTWLTLLIDVPRTEAEDAVAFWARVTDAPASPRRGENGQFVTLLPAAGDPCVAVQAVGGDGGVHLDLHVEDQAASTAGAVDLGARFVTRYDDVDVLRSPGGLPFCVAAALPGRPRLARGNAAVLDQVCLDIPASRWDAEVAFWRDVTGRELVAGGRPEFARLIDPDPAGPLRILLQRTESDDGPVRAHPDFAVADREAVQKRHVSAGAELVETFDWWSVLRAPGGQVYCLTDRDPTTGTTPR